MTTVWGHFKTAAQVMGVVRLAGLGLGVLAGAVGVQGVRGDDDRVG